MSSTTAVALAAGQFGPFDGQCWLNTAHQGPLPRPAVQAGVLAGRRKAQPWLIEDTDFTAVPERLRDRLATLLGTDPDQIVLGDSTSHGLHLIANGLDWVPGDEVLTVAGDYPATVLPWHRLAADGVRVRALRPAGDQLDAEDVRAALGPRTRVLAVTWVDSFTGRALDLAALGTVCRAAGVLLVVNGAQAVGARPLDLAGTPVDALVGCGYKFLCGPYGTGFTWLRADLLARLRPRQAYWLAMHAGRGLDQMRDTSVRTGLGVRAFDVFCPASFHRTLPFIAALEVLLPVGVPAIAAADQALVGRLVAGLDPERYALISPPAGPSRSTLVVLAARDGSTERRHQWLRSAGVHAAFREGNLRLSVHLFNTPADIDRALTALADRLP